MQAIIDKLNERLREAEAQLEATKRAFKSKGVYNARLNVIEARVLLGQLAVLHHQSTNAPTTSPDSGNGHGCSGEAAPAGEAAKVTHLKPGRLKGEQLDLFGREQGDELDLFGREQGDELDLFDGPMGTDAVLEVVDLQSNSG